MSQKKISKIVPKLWYLRGEFLALAVLRVFRENEKLNGVQDSFSFDSNDSTWIRNSDLRKDLYDRTKKNWSSISGRDFTWFPFSEDAVVFLYGGFQGKNEKRLLRWERELENACNT